MTIDKKALIKYNLLVMIDRTLKLPLDFTPPLGGEVARLYLTEEELFVPAPDGFAPMGRLILTAMSELHPVDTETGKIATERVGVIGQKMRAAHPYVSIELLEPGETVKPFKRGDKEYYVHDDALYRVTISTDPEIHKDIRGQTDVNGTYYSAESGRINVLVPRQKHVQTYFPGGKK